MGKLILAAVVVAGLLVPGAASALEAVPFQTANRSVLVQPYGLPVAEPARLVAAGTTETALTMEVANTFQGGRNVRTGEELLLDGEMYRWNLSVRKRLGEKIEGRIDIPFILHGGGFLDGFIDGWHDTFNLPAGGRDHAERGRLLYRYDRKGRTLIDFDHAAGGVGDVRLSAAVQLFEDEQRALAVHAGLKLPTGDPDRLTSSGSVDGSLSLAGSASTSTSWGRLTLFGSAGGLGMTRGDILPEQQRSFVGFGTLGAGWAPWKPMVLTLQLGGHTSFYDSGLSELSSASAQLVIGGSVALTNTTTLDIGVVEDVVVGTSPDVVFHLALRQVF